MTPEALGELALCAGGPQFTFGALGEKWWG